MLATGASVLVALACASGSSASAPSTASVSLHDIAFHPAKVTIRAGGTVTWTWHDADIDTEHNVTSKSGGLRFKSSTTRLTGSYTVRFNKPGKYLYQCTIHPASMQGEVIVK